MSETPGTGTAPEDLKDTPKAHESVEDSFIDQLKDLDREDAADVAVKLNELYGDSGHDFSSWSDEELYKFVGAVKNNERPSGEKSDYSKVTAEQKEAVLNGAIEAVANIDKTRKSDEDYHEAINALEAQIAHLDGITGSEAYAIIEQARDKYYGVNNATDESNSTMEAKAEAGIEVRKDTEPKAAGVPKDADNYKIDDIERDAPVLGWRARAMKKLGLVKGAGFGGNAVLATWQLIGKRAEKQAAKQAKIDAMTPEEHKKYLNRNRAITALGVLGATVVVLGTKGFGFMDGSGGNNASNVTPDEVNNDVKSEAGNAGTFREADAVSMEYSNTSFNNSDSSFYDFANKEHRGDFGPSLITNADHGKDTVGGTYNAGYNDWVERGKHEPNGLGNLRVGLGLEGGDKNFEQRNQVADYLDSNPKIHEARNQETWAALNDPSKFKVETIKIEQPYTSTYMTDVNGDPVIGQQEHVDYGGEAFKITDAKTGEVTLWRKDCGGFQQIWLEDKPAPAPVQQEVVTPVAAPQQVESTPQGTGGQTTTPSKPTTTVPNKPTTPTIPTVPTTPTTPVTPVTPEVPVTPAPKDPTKDINVDPNLPDQVKMGDDRVGSGAPQTEAEVTTPGGSYTDPTKDTDTKPSGETAPGAAPAPEVSAPKPESQPGANPSGGGNNSGSVSE